jgi:hypothetical protein
MQAPPRHKVANRERKAAPVALAFALAILFPLMALAARPVRVYDVSVKASDTAATLSAAMREVLVRATGRRDAADDSALAAMVSSPEKYVISTRPAGNGEVEVHFDGPALERDIVAAGRSVWDSERPFTVVVLNPPPTSAAADTARRSIEEIAEGRGLPVSLVPVALTDGSGNELSSDALLQNVRNMGGDAVLLGRADPTLPEGQWRWTLQTSVSSENWSGPFEAGINGAADALARVQGSTLSLVESDADVRINGVAALPDYANVERMLSGLPGVRRSGLEEADGTTATFRVRIRGGAEAVARALENSARLTRTESAGSELEYQYHP